MQFLSCSLCLLAATSLALANTSVTNNNVKGNDNQVTTKTDQKQETKLKVPLRPRDLESRALLSLISRDPDYEYAMELLARGPPPASAGKGAAAPPKGQAPNPDAPSPTDIAKVEARIKSGQVSAPVVDAAIKAGHIKKADGFTPTADTTDATSMKVAKWLNNGGPLTPGIEKALIDSKHYLAVKTDQTPNHPLRGSTKAPPPNKTPKVVPRETLELDARDLDEGFGDWLWARDAYYDTSDVLSARGAYEDTNDLFYARDASDDMGDLLSARDANEDISDLLYVRDADAMAAAYDLDFEDLYI